MQSLFLVVESSIVVFAAYLGWAAALLAAVVAVPQVVRLVRTRSVAGISVTAWQLTLAANLAWTMHGVITGHANIVVPNAVFALLSTTVLILLQRSYRMNPVLLLAPSLVAGLVCAGVDLTLGPVAFALVSGLPTVVAWLMQLHELVIAPRITGFSLPYVALNTINQGVWAFWGLLVGEQSVIICAITFAILMGSNLGWAMLRRRGLVRARLSAMWA